MNFKDMKDSMRKILARTLDRDDLYKHIILQKGSNNYQAFGSYFVRQLAIDWEVTLDFSDKVMHFSAAKVALSWCVAHKSKNYNLAQLIYVLDKRMRAKQNDIDLVSQRLNMDISEEVRAILQSRLSADISDRNTIRRELNGCLEKAKAIKIAN